ncbi:MAG: insulinase family protein [Armatimonadetes bacterium]|nr:insulinase family protein [Armatimonadota bacterium]
MKKHFLLFFFLSFLLTFSAVAAGPKITEKELSNGLKVLMVEEHKAPVATFQVWYRVGAIDENPGRTGLSHLLEHMMFKGTKKYGVKTFSRIVSKNGGNDNAFTSEDYTAYFENLASDRISIALDLESDRMKDILALPKEFQAERDVVIEERRMRTEDEPISDLVEEMMAVAFKAHPYGWPIIGWMSDLKRVTRDEMYRHYKAYYVPNNAVIVVAGDINPKDLFPKIEKYFGPIKSGPKPLRNPVVEPPQRGPRRVTLYRDAELPFVAIGYHVPNLTSPDSVPLAVLSSILSDGRSSRLHRSLVYEKQLAFFAEGSYDRVTRDPQLFYVYANAMPQIDIKVVEQAMLEEIEKIRKTPVSERDLQKAKNRAESSFVLRQDSIFYQAMILGQHEIAGGWRYYEKFLGELRKVTQEDVQRVARKYLTEENCTTAVLIPQKARATESDSKR